MKLYSLKTKFIGVFATFIFVSSMFLTLLSARSIKLTGERFSKEQGSAIVAKALTFVDTSYLASIANNPNPSDPRLIALQQEFQSLKESVGCRFLYIMAPVSGTTYQYIVDGSDPSSDDYSPTGSQDDISSWGKAPLETMQTAATTSSGITKQEGWGYQISTYKGIKSSNGRIIAFIGCDFDADTLNQIILAEVVKMIIAGVVVLILGSLIIYQFSTSIFNSIRSVAQSMMAIADGTADLTTRIETHGKSEIAELANSCNGVMDNVGNMVRSVHDNAKVLQDSSNELFAKMSSHIKEIKESGDDISDINSQIDRQNSEISLIADSMDAVESVVTDLDSRINDQSAAIEQSSSAIEQISSNINSVNHSVEMISNEYASLVAQAKQGNKLQNDMSEQITAIAQQSENLNEANSAIAAIAEQTNLLAMNAAIEAAHAGDLGKGFAVVANEIRDLAETSAEQTKAINDLLNNISYSIQTIVSSSQQSSEAFQSVGTKINAMDSVVSEIKNGMIEEKAGVENILDMMHTLETTTSAITSAALTMKGESGKLFTSINSLKETSDHTREKSVHISQKMTSMLSVAEQAVSASSQSKDATEKVVELVAGYSI